MVESTFRRNEDGGDEEDYISRQDGWNPLCKLCSIRALAEGALKNYIARLIIKKSNSHRNKM